MPELFVVVICGYFRDQPSSCVPVTIDWMMVCALRDPSSICFGCCPDVWTSLLTSLCLSPFTHHWDL